MKTAKEWLETFGASYAAHFTADDLAAVQTDALESVLDTLRTAQLAVSNADCELITAQTKIANLLEKIDADTLKHSNRKTNNQATK